MIINFILFAIIVLLVIISRLNNVPKEHFKGCLYNVIKPSCNKKYIFKEIEKLEDKISRLSYIIKSRSMDKAKVNQMFNWYQNKQKRETQFKRAGQKNVENQIAAFAEETESRMKKDRQKGDKIHKKAFSREKRMLDKAYKPLKI